MTDIPQTTEDRARAIASRWLHGDDEHRKWLLNMVVPDLVVFAAECERSVLINAWHAAKDGCLLLPDGGSPTEGEVAVSSRAANRIRAMMPDSKLPILGDEA